MARKSLNQFSRTKTVATVGPACATVEKLGELISHGVNVFRLNMAHGSRADHEAAIKNIRAASDAAELPVGILVDLAGPKIRLGQLAVDPLALENGQELEFVRGTESKEPHQLTSNYERLIDELSDGDAIVLADGIARLEVVEKTADVAKCKVVDGGKVRSRQGVNLPATKLSVPALGDVDKDNARWAATQSIDFVSLSFVRNADEINELKELLAGENCNAWVIAKIEKQEALENLEEIVRASDGIMVARGDLGVEIAIEKTPVAQKRIIQICTRLRKPVIVATQMLESMHNTKQPTRAEASDVANAILDGADACMLSGETAIGEYPVEAVSMMQRIMLETEELIPDLKRKLRNKDDDKKSRSISDAVVYGAAKIAKRLSAKVVVIATSTGDTPRLKAKQRDFIKTICITDKKDVLNKMCLLWSIIPIHVPSLLDQKQLRTFINIWAKAVGNAETGDPIVLVTDTDFMPAVHDAVTVCEVS